MSGRVKTKFLALILVFLLANSGVSWADSSTDRINEAVKATFTPDSQRNTPLTTQELINIALNRSLSADQNIANNIRSNALWYLQKRLDKPDDASLIKKYAVKFKAEVDDERNGYLRQRFAELLSNVPGASELDTKTIILMLSESSLNEPYPKWQAAKEDKAISLIQKLHNRPQDADYIMQQVPLLLKQKWMYALRTAGAGLDVMKEYLPKSSPKVAQELVQTFMETKNRFEADKVRAASFNKPNSAHMITVSDYYTDEEITAYLNKFEKVVCSHSFQPNVRTWEYIIYADDQNRNPSEPKKFKCSAEKN